jgi:hypothetical protein
VASEGEASEGASLAKSVSLSWDNTEAMRTRIKLMQALKGTSQPRGYIQAISEQGHQTFCNRFPSFVP